MKIQGGHPDFFAIAEIRMKIPGGHEHALLKKVDNVSTG